jgi:hypothetical protein
VRAPVLPADAPITFGPPQLAGRVWRDSGGAVGLAWSKHHCRARHLGPEVAAELNPAIDILSMSDGCSVLDLEQPSTLTSR